MALAQTSGTTIEDLLFEIARNLDFKLQKDVGGDGAVARLVARREGRGFVPEIEIEFAGRRYLGGDWYDLPEHLASLARLLGDVRDPVRTFAGRMGTDGMLVLSANGAEGRVLGDLTYAYSRADGMRARFSSTEQLARAGDIAGIPAVLVASLQSLNAFLRRTHPLAAPASIPVKFWNAPEHSILHRALQYLPNYLLEPFSYDPLGFAGLPPGYRTAYIVFEALEQIENEGLRTAIDNLGPAYCDDLVEQLEKIGVRALGDHFRRAWAAQRDAEADPLRFRQARRIVLDALEDEAFFQAVARYFAGRPELFEERAAGAGTLR